MNILLIFFALPIATIIISIALQKILKCPALVAAIIFSIFLIVTFVVNDLNLLIATIVYTILSFITAVIVCWICKLLDNFKRNNNCNKCNCKDNTNELLTINSSCQNNENGELLTISSNGCNGMTNDLLTINSNGKISNNCECNNSCNNECSNSCNNQNDVSARINIIPNTNTNGRSGCVCGSYRRK